MREKYEFLSPVYTDTILFPLKQVTASASFSCVLTFGGQVNCWGANGQRQLGTGIEATPIENTPTYSSTPVRIKDLSDISQVAVGSAHGCAVTKAGAAKCWGLGTSGQLGDEDLMSHSTPQNVFGLSSGVVAITAGDTHTCALLSSGLVNCWGQNNRGQMGLNQAPVSGLYSTKPREISASSLANVAFIVAGKEHTCAIDGSGILKCWGANAYGQIGIGHTSDVTTPYALNLAENVLKVAAGVDHTCAMMASGTVKCWGRNDAGQLGLGNTTNYGTAQTVSSISSVIDIAAGKKHTCALTSDKKTFCWGATPAAGSLSSTTPREISDLSGVGVAIFAGEEFTCLQVSTGTGVKCWGKNASGELGNGNTTDSGLPQDIVTLSKAL